MSKANDCFLDEMYDAERKFIQNIVNARKEKSLTQKDISERTGLTQQVVSEIERGRRKPVLTNVIKYLGALGLDINDLFK